MNGLNSMKYPLDVLMILMSLSPTFAETETLPDVDLLPVEFLEFLSEWETNHGEWAGFGMFEDSSFEQLFDEKAEDIEKEVEDAE